MQNKGKIVFNPRTMQFESAKRSKLKRAVFLMLVVVAATAGYSFVHYYISLDSNLQNTYAATELKRLEDKYKILSNELTSYEQILETIHEKDSRIYAQVLGVSPVDEDIWQAGTGGAKVTAPKYANLFNLNVNKIEDKAAKLKYQLELQNQSLNKLSNAVKEYEERIACIPSIKPVKEEALNRKITLLSGFGKRLHPVFKIWRQHEGIDFSCPTGTRIVATGKGIVESVNGKGRGYGQHVVVNHGYGYKSLYAHMSTINVREGQPVERGSFLGKVGATGTATAPHLHYEIHKDGKPINPIDYVLDGLNPEEYQELIKLAAIEGKSLD